MSALPGYWSAPEDEPVIGLIPFPAREAAGAHGEWLPVAAAAGLLGISASTLRRAVKRAWDRAPASAVRVEAEHRGRWFAARRTQHGRRQQWQVCLIRRPLDVIPEEAVASALRRVADFREAHAHEWQERPLEHTRGRHHWWQLWRPA